MKVFWLNGCVCGWIHVPSEAQSLLSGDLRSLEWTKNSSIVKKDNL